MPHFLAEGGLMIWVILGASALALAVFCERLLQYHREQINSTEFLNGVRNVLRRDNVVEALAICDATPGPVARLVKVAILNRERGREAVREALEDAGAWEVPRLEQKLNVLATVAQIAPLMGLLGTVLGFMKVFKTVQDAGLNAHVGQLSLGIWQALICTAAGLAVAIPSYAGYNYLVGRVNNIVLDMEQVSSEILTTVTSPMEPVSRAP
ncbi:MAG TPA: MotA/TolQ/ExbB proton channel family protein [Candidatus Saccharimonadales bacterium]|nr:MotA/TolQ/ExbB proton channel family protein [Candidatus Saccharimonadales bacterium]